MKVHLFYADADPDPEAPDPPGSDALVRDLGLDTLVNAMGQGDGFLTEVARHTVLRSLPEVAGVRYRQQVLTDCLRAPDLARTLYRLAGHALESTKQVRGWYVGDYPRSVLSHAVGLLETLMDDLHELRQFTDEHADQFTSPGFATMFAGLGHDLSDDYFVVLGDHLRRLKFPTGVIVTAQLGDGCKGTDYVLRKPRRVKRGWREVLQIGDRSAYTVKIHERDEAGARALSELRDRGLNLIADALGQSTDHILSFFTMLRFELGFYIGCLNLHQELSGRNLATCIPDPIDPEECELRAEGLYDVALGLRARKDVVVGNDVAGTGESLIMITGANQGGKSTLLRGIGLAQLMMQAGMFVPAVAYRSSMCTGLHTHFKREEDSAMESGKLEEELARMSQILDRVTPDGWVLFNESFASTNEREGSTIARQVIDGLREAGVRVVCVTHMFDLAHSLQDADGVACLRPERLADGTRTFRIIEGAPLPTSHGRDVYDRVFDRPTPR